MEEKLEAERGSQVEEECAEYFKSNQLIGVTLELQILRCFSILDAKQVCLGS